MQFEVVHLLIKIFGINDFSESGVAGEQARDSLDDRRGDGLQQEQKGVVSSFAGVGVEGLAGERDGGVGASQQQPQHDVEVLADVGAPQGSAADAVGRVSLAVVHQQQLHDPQVPVAARDAQRRRQLDVPA